MCREGRLGSSCWRHHKSSATGRPALHSHLQLIALPQASLHFGLLLLLRCPPSTKDRSNMPTANGGAATGRGLPAMMHRLSQRYQAIAMRAAVTLRGKYGRLAARRAEMHVTGVTDGSNVPVSDGPGNEQANRCHARHQPSTIPMPRRANATQ
jgi:hypothetical protein